MTKAQIIKLTVFLIATVALGAGLLVLFTGQALFRSNSEYYVRVPGSVEGIERGSAVAVRGVRVGSVKQIELYADDLESVRLTLEVGRAVRIMKNAKATLAYKGVTGLKFVQINGGDGSQGQRVPGSYIPYQESLLERVSDQASEIVVRAGDLLGTTNELLSRVSDAASRIDVRRVDAILASAEHALAAFDAAGTQVRTLVRQAKPPIQRSLHSADATLQSTASAAEDARALISNLDGTVTEVKQLVRQNEGQLRIIARNLSDATQSFRDLGRELQQRPSRLLLSEAPEERKLP